MFGSSTKNPKWRGGYYTSDKGYKRISARVGRNKYFHRDLIEKLLLDPIGLIYYGGTMGIIPPGMTIHHWDHRKEHNCYCNLQLLDKAIHDFCEREYRKFIRENYEEWCKFWEGEGRWE